jgi:hypothetical protein
VAERAAAEVAVTQRNLTRRLEELEKRVRPVTEEEPLIVNLMYVSPDGTSELAEQFIIPMPLDPVHPWERIQRVKK